MKVRIGTSGFQYAEWKGTFYPETLSKAKMLPYYADIFSTTEINYSFRRIPSRKTLENWGALTPGHFVFSLKAPQKVTHFAKLQGCADTVAFFFEEVSYLGEKLGPTLFQLPPSFEKDARVLEDFLSELPQGMRVAFEFRHASWFDDEIFVLLKQHNAALCLAESADLVTPFIVTADFGYLRLRREDYTRKTIAKWGKQIEAHAAAWEDAFVYFKHEEIGVGPKFAGILQNLLPPDLLR